MSLQQILKAAGLSSTKQNGFLIFILAGLVVAENFIERDFQCICKRIIGVIFFTFYLVMPAFIVFTVTFCIMSELERQKSETPAEGTQNQKPAGGAQNQMSAGGTQNQESAEGAQNQKTNQRSFILRCVIPSIFWIILFLSDGRYVACVATILKGDYSDSTALPPWEWCNENRTLSTDQKQAETAYIISKGVGFGLLLLCSFVILVYGCCKECGASSEQARAERGNAGKQDSK
ncbi:uncharacterized protein LOC118820645 [Colossoma macropomum]|uniref:uncharacterized protein LOC118820645 n=1 Tax=Colossoma macropomum TaxID=42526 RepID=UPI001863EE86|nr:uncharacterized protein LOC118820645 [Colossoma macropomum]